MTTDEDTHRIGRRTTSILLSKWQRVVPGCEENRSAAPDVGAPTGPPGTGTATTLASG